MIFYLCNGNQLAPTQAEARAIDRNFEQIDVPTSKLELMNFINKLYHEHDMAVDMADGGMIDDDRPISPALDVDNFPKGLTAPPETYLSRSIEWDELFPTLPICHQLHFAGMALENARTAIARTTK